MTRCACILAAMAFAVATGAVAGEFQPWPAGSEPAIIDRDPWMDEAAATVHDDAFVFSDVAHGQSLSPEIVAIATRFDIELLARPHKDFSGLARTDAGPRIAWSFDRFVSIGSDGRAYASLDLARGRAGPASLAQGPSLSPAVLAMITGR